MPELGHFKRSSATPDHLVDLGLFPSDFVSPHRFYTGTLESTARKRHTLQPAVFLRPSPRTNIVNLMADLGPPTHWSGLLRSVLIIHVPLRALKLSISEQEIYAAGGSTMPHRVVRLLVVPRGPILIVYAPIDYLPHTPDIAMDDLVRHSHFDGECVANFSET